MHATSNNSSSVNRFMVVDVEVTPSQQSHCGSLTWETDKGLMDK